MCGFFIFDAFGSFTGIRYSGHHRIRTNLGGVLTVFCFIATLVTIAFFGNIYISGSNMSQINNEFKYWKSQNITANDDFKFAIANIYQGNIDMRDDVYKMEAYYVDYDVKTLSSKKTKLK